MLQSILIALAFLVGGTENTQETYTVDASASQIDWLGKKVTGEHNGTIALKDGSFEFTDGKLTGGNFTVDMTSIDNSDLEGEWKGKLVGHLKSDDFFGVEKYPTAKFVITGVVSQGPGKYKITGDMTIKDKTNEVKFNADFKENDDQLTGLASIVIDRSEYDVRYGSGSFFDDLGDKTIYDDFELTVKIVANK